MKKITIYVLAFILVAFQMPSALAAEWSFYGSARMATYWIGDDPGGDGESDEGLQWSLAGNRRIGANVKNGAIGDRFEYGTGVNVRHLYGTWDFGNGVLLIGQAYTPLGSYFYSNQVF
ncbi:MAG: hypothetical protein H8E81_07765, partial [Deltaproteobacteria bacterium]|nr:hypothetical protein [Deltaproteobacteria bacterium]